MTLINPETPRTPDMLLEVEDPETHQVEIAGIYHEERGVPAFFVEASSPAISGLKTFFQGRTVDGREVNVFSTPNGLETTDRTTFL